MIIEDDRTPEQKATHYMGVVTTAWFAFSGPSYAVWACLPDDIGHAKRWVASRSDARRVRVVDLTKYRPRGPGHVHIYVYNPEYGRQS